MRLDKTLLRSFLSRISFSEMWLGIALIMLSLGCSKSKDAPQSFGIQIINPTANRYFLNDQSFNVKVLFDLYDNEEDIDELSFTIISESGSVLGPVVSNAVTWKGDTASRIMWLGDYEVNNFRSVFVKVKATIDGVTRLSFREIFIETELQDLGWIKIDSSQNRFNSSFFNLDTNFIMDQFNGGFYSAEIDLESRVLWIAKSDRLTLVLYDLLESRVLKEIQLPNQINVLKQQESTLFVGTNLGYVYRYNSAGTLLGVLRLDNNPDDVNVIDLFPKNDQLFVKALNQISSDTGHYQMLITTGFVLRSYQLENAMEALFLLEGDRFLLFQEYGVYEFYANSGVSNRLHTSGQVRGVNKIGSNLFALLIEGELWLYNFSNNSLVKLSDEADFSGISFQSALHLLACYSQNEVAIWDLNNFEEILGIETEGTKQLLAY